MEQHDEGKAEQFLKDLGKRLDKLIAEAKEAGSRLETDIQARFEELKAAGERFKNEAENKERWREVEASLKKAGEELNNALKAAFRKKDEQPPV
jgi:restriction endonuclease S subunit